MSLSTRIRVWTCPVAGSQIRAVLSLLPEASQLPSGVTATASTPLVWPVRVARSRHVYTRPTAANAYSVTYLRLLSLHTVLRNEIP
jgi:hypothetical protein